MVMDQETPNYRLERWIALFLTLLFFLPFVAKADEPIRVSTASAPARIAFAGEASTLTWSCTATRIDDFRQCALTLDDRVVAWRMAPEGEELQAVVTFSGDLDRDSRLDLVVEISRSGAPASVPSSRVRFLSSATPVRRSIDG
jgi:hypothetical protein